MRKLLVRSCKHIRCRVTSKFEQWRACMSIKLLSLLTWVEVKTHKSICVLGGKSHWYLCWGPVLVIIVQYYRLWRARFYAMLRSSPFLFCLFLFSYRGLSCFVGVGKDVVMEVQDCVKVDLLCFKTIEII